MTLTWTAEKPSWRCGSTLAATEAPELRPSPFGEPYAPAARARWPPRRAGTARWSIEKSRSATQSPSSSSSTSSRIASMPILSTSTLMRARARLTRSQSWRSKMRKHGLGPLEVLAVVGGRRTRTSVGATRGMIDVPPPTRISKPLTPSRSRGDEGDVVDAGERAVGVGARERRLDLARHQLRRGVAHEVAHVGADVGRRVEDLVVADAGPRVGGHVADGVAAALAAGQAGVGDLADQRRRRRAAGRGGSGCSAAS